MSADTAPKQQEQASTKERKPLGGESRTVLLSEVVSEGLPENWRIYVQQVRPDLNPDSVFNEFCFYWLEGRGAGKRRSARGWSSAWQNWIKREREPVTGTATAPVREKTAAEKRAYREQINKMYGLDYSEASPESDDLASALFTTSQKAALA